jgi:hypothetical protein
LAGATDASPRAARAQAKGRVPGQRRRRGGGVGKRVAREKHQRTHTHAPASLVAAALSGLFLRVLHFFTVRSFCLFFCPSWARLCLPSLGRCLCPVGSGGAARGAREASRQPPRRPPRHIRASRRRRHRLQPPPADAGPRGGGPSGASRGQRGAQGAAPSQRARGEQLRRARRERLRWRHARRNGGARRSGPSELVKMACDPFLARRQWFRSWHLLAFWLAGSGHARSEFLSNQKVYRAQPLGVLLCFVCAPPLM